MLIKILRTLQLLALLAVIGCAYTVSFPYGIGETYRFIQFELQHYHYGGTAINREISIKDGFGMDVDQIIANKLTELQVNVLKPDEIAIINVIDNSGGSETQLASIATAILRSKAEIFLTVKHFGMSCGTFVLNQGDYIMLPNDATLLIHTGSVTDGFHEAKIKGGTGDPNMQATYEETVLMFGPWLAYLSPNDKARYLDGQDVFITGKEVCDSYDGSTPPILFHYNGGCLLKGVK